MHSSQKKPKQRIRNRPRNKANRVTENGNGTDPATEATAQPVASVAVADKLAVNLREILNEKIHENSAPGTASEANVQPAAATLPRQQDDNHMIQLIQQLIRNKLLNNNNNKNNNKSDNTNETQQQNTSEQQNAVNGVGVGADEVKAAASATTTRAAAVPATAGTTTTTATATAAKQAIYNKIKQAKALKETLKEASDGGDNDLKCIDKNLFLNHLQKKVDNAKTNDELPAALLSNLQKLLEQEPISDIESDDDEEEYIEYIYKPRPYFVVSLCNFCKCDLFQLQQQQQLMPCSGCQMTYYCSKEHMKSDKQHRQICWAIRQVADGSNGHIFYKCGDFSTEQFRSYRIVNIKKIESVMNRPLTATEQEVILFPRICNNIKCREYRFERLADCETCGQAAYCKKQPDHLNPEHKKWCAAFKLFKEYIMFQEKFGRLEPSLPTKILKDLPAACTNTKQILKRFGFDMQDACEYAALSQLSTGPLTAWYALKLCEQLKSNSSITIHLIGAEIEFEVDALHKWELFFMHITPAVKELNIVFVGPELNPNNISFEQLKRTKCCRSCRKLNRSINYHFENKIYHDYCAAKEFIKPTLVCFFNAGLYRSTGYHWEDTWPETIFATANLKCPVVVTSYTQYEAPLDLTRFIQESNRRLNIVLPPIINPFASEKPERNFISDDEAPLMFKNYYCFVVE